MECGDSQIGALTSGLKSLVRHIILAARFSLRPSLRPFSLALLLLAMLFTASWALATSYVYDANGRLVVVTNDAGQSARYVYDEMGNIVRIERLEADDLAVFSFSPGRGATDVAVKVQGHGFSATPGQNTVKFNGVTAAVSAATATELTTAVPVTATTGPITVTVGAETASSPIDFVVDEDAQPPIITSVSPLVAEIGDPITVGGTHFNPIVDQTTVRLNQRSATPSSLNDTQAIFPVPAGAGSGKVSVSTPFGTAISSHDVLVVPSGTAAGDIEQRKRLAVDAPAQGFLVTVTGKYAAALFDANTGDYLSAQFTSISASNVSYWLYGTNNRMLVTGTVTSTNPTVHFPKLTAGGTYLLLMKPEWGPATWELAIERDKAVANNGADTNITTTVMAQSKRLTFAATTGQKLGMALTELAYTGDYPYAYAYVYDPNGLNVASTSCYGSNPGCDLNLMAQMSGVYTVVIPSASDQTMSFRATLSTDLAGMLTLDAPQTVVLGRHGQNARLAFAGTAGQRVGLRVANQTTLPADQIVYYTITAPDGSFVSAMSPQASGTLNFYLPQTGSYQVLVDPYYGGKASLEIIVASGVTGEGEPDGASGSYATTVPGMNAYLSFAATAGQRLGLGLSELAYTGGYGYAHMYVYAPDGAQVAMTTCYDTNPGCDLNLAAETTGTYTAVLFPSASDQTMSFKATLSTDLIGALAIDTPQTVTLGRRGQNARLTFTGAAGQRVGLRVANQTTGPVDQNVYYTVTAPDGSYVSSMVPTTSGTSNLYLPQTGNYEVFVDPYYGATADMQLMIGLGVTDQSQPDGASGTYATTMPGMNVYLSFTATAGQKLGMALSELVYTGGSGYAYLYVYDPNASNIASTTCSDSTPGCDLNLAAETTGTYIAVVIPSTSDQTMSFKSTLSTDLSGTLTLDTPQTVTLGRRGQNARLAFAGTAGQRVGLQVANQSTGPADQNVYYTVTAPDGSYVHSMVPVTSGTLNFYLPQTGNYQVFVDPYYGATANLEMMVASGVTGQSVPDGAAGTYATVVPGMNVYLSFTATAGQKLGMALSELSYTGGSGYAYLYVYDPNASNIASTTCYDSTPGCDLNLTIETTGTYIAVVIPSTSDQAMSFKSTLSTDQTGTLTLDTPQTVTLGRRGQNTRLSFAGTTGQRVGLRVTNQMTAPADYSAYYTVTAPDGSYVHSMASATGGTLNIYLPQTGNYQVLVDPVYGVTADFQITMGSGVTGQIVPDGATSTYTTTMPGMNVYLSFSATAGQKLGMALSELAYSGGSGYAYLYVYDPDGNNIASTTCYDAYPGCDVNLTAETTGTHIAVVIPSTSDQTMSVKATLSTDLAGTLALNTPQTVTLGRRGKNARMSFAATAGQDVNLVVASQSTNPVDQYVNYTVYTPEGTYLTAVNALIGAVVPLSDLPSTGNYLVFVDPYYGSTSSASMKIASSP